MKRLLLAAVLLAQTGCLAPLTRRLDSSNRHLEGLQVQLQDANDSLRRLEQRLDETNRRLQSVERSMKRLTGEGDE
jgi:septal ring factor EnvC (AmiA/AmiB activator)